MFGIYGSRDGNTVNVERWDDGGIGLGRERKETLLWSLQGFRLRLLAPNSHFSQNFWQKSWLIHEMRLSHTPSPCQTIAKKERKHQKKRELGGRERRGRGKRYKHQRENVGVTVATVTRAGKTTATSLNPTNLRLYFLPFILLFLLTLLKLGGGMKTGSRGPGWQQHQQHTNICRRVPHVRTCSRLACHASAGLLLRTREAKATSKKKRNNQLWKKRSSSGLEGEG